MAEVVEN